MQTTRTKWIIGIGVMVATIVVLGIIGALLPSDDEPDNSAGARATSTGILQTPAVAAEPSETMEPDPTEKPEDTPEPTWKDGVPLSNESVLRALEDGDEMTRSVNIGKPKGIAINDGDIFLTYKIEDALKETDMLTIGGQTAFSAHRALFENPLGAKRHGNRTGRLD